MLKISSPEAQVESPAVKVLMRAWGDVGDEVGEMLGKITFEELVDRLSRVKSIRAAAFLSDPMPAVKPRN